MYHLIVVGYGMLQFFVQHIECVENCIISQALPPQTNFCTYYCCGNSTYSYCCADCSKRINAQGSSCGNEAQNSTAIILGCTVGLTIFVAITLLLPSIKKCLPICGGRLLRGGRHCPSINAAHSSSTTGLESAAENASTTGRETNNCSPHQRPRPPHLSINADLFFIRSDFTFAPPSPLPPYKETDPENQPPSFEDALRPEAQSSFPSQMNSPVNSPMRYDDVNLTRFPTHQINLTIMPSSSERGDVDEDCHDPSCPTPPPPYSDVVIVSQASSHIL